jgi:hypothetical protein
MVMSPQMSIVAAPASRRVPRRPSHTFQLLSQYPNVITPFCIAPVLPGETLKSLQLQSRVVTDPLLSPLMGWWLEYSFFYVKLRDLTARSTVETMILDPDAGSAALNDTTASAQYYHAGNANPNWLKLCMEPIVREYFRDEGETWNAQVRGSLPKAQVNNKLWSDSLFGESEIPDAATEVGAENFDVYEARYRTWLMLRQQKMVNMTFEEYLGTYGVDVPKETAGVPELIRHVRQWTYPSSTVDPATGVPSNACFWSVAERADKDRFFLEPGFIVGISVARPKIYHGNQVQTAVTMLTDQRTWLPAVMADDPSTSVTIFSAATKGPLLGFAVNYWADVRDLFVHGDQFLDTDGAAAQGHISLPSSSGHTASLYAADADLDALFVSGAANKIKQDGIVNLHIMGTQLDNT